jgi:hypothetical protein
MSGIEVVLEILTIVSLWLFVLLLGYGRRASAAAAMRRDGRPYWRAIRNEPMSLSGARQR